MAAQLSTDAEIDPLTEDPDQLPSISQDQHENLLDDAKRLSDAEENSDAEEEAINDSEQHHDNNLIDAPPQGPYI